MGFTEDARVAALSPCNDLDGNLKAEDVKCPCLTLAEEKDPNKSPTVCWVPALGVGQ